MEENRQPLLSICIPTYNREKFLKESLNKIVQQLHNPKILNKVEIVISDNDSKDNTGALVQSFGIHYNIKYFKNEYNIGGLANIIKVTEHANGRYIWLLSDDDCITDFALQYVIEIIEKENFDVMFCNVLPSENMNINIEKKANNYEGFNGISEYLGYLRKWYKGYKNLISFFSFYSILIVKTEYFRKGLEEIDFNGNDFPHNMLIYNNLKKSKIIIPNNTFLICRLLNEGYVGSTKLIKSFNLCMDFVEERNELKNNSDRKYIKKICKNGWTKNIILGLIISKLHINYKTNKFLKKIYYFYKKWIQ